jgi:hypothetical protein
MVPSFFIAVDELPATVNGKIDLRALPDPFSTRAAAEERMSPARDEVEDAIAALWAKILGVDVDRIGPDADFYRLGGDSLKMVEMLSAVAVRVAGRDQDAAFMRQVRPVIKRPTLESVCRAVKAAHPQTSSTR